MAPPAADGRARRPSRRSRAGGAGLILLPTRPPRPGAVVRRVHGLVVVVAPGGQLDHVTVGITEVDRIDEAVVGDAAGLDPGPPALFEHGVELLAAGPP